MTDDNLNESEELETSIDPRSVHKIADELIEMGKKSGYPPREFVLILTCATMALQDTFGVRVKEIREINNGANCPDPNCPVHGKEKKESSEFH